MLNKFFGLFSKDPAVVPLKAGHYGAGIGIDHHAYYA